MLPVKNPSRRFRALGMRALGLAGVLAAAAVGAVTGCTTDSSVRIQSVQNAVMDVPDLPVAAYWASDPSTADIYLTDLDAAALDPGTDMSRVSGRIVHFHLFMVPLAGSTPIGSEACSVMVRHIVLARGSIGVYAGGGFLLPSGRPGDPEFGGSVKGATLRLAGKTPSFVDRLGAATMDAGFAAPRDEATAKRIAARVNDVLGVVERSGGK